MTAPAVAAEQQTHPWERIELLGVPFDPLTEQGVIAHVIDSIRSGQGGWIVNPNTDVIRQTVERSELRDLVHTADLVLADGMPLIWISRLLGSPLPERVAGSTLISSLSHAAADAKVPVYLLGGAPTVAERAGARLARESPDLVVGHYSPPFGFDSDPAALRAIDNAIARFGPAIYYCGFGFPKQERLMAQLAVRFPGSWFVGSGASLDFLAGATKRAPAWMQRSGLEWLYRLRQEPRRLFRRYIIDDTPFAARVLATAGGAALRRWVHAKLGNTRVPIDRTRRSPMPPPRCIK